MDVAQRGVVPRPSPAHPRWQRIPVHVFAVEEQAQGRSGVGARAGEPEGDRARVHTCLVRHGMNVFFFHIICILAFGDVASSHVLLQTMA